MILSRNNQRLLTSTSNLLKINNAKLKVAVEYITILNPENILQRGYSITSLNGRVIKDVESA